MVKMCACRFICVCVIFNSHLIWVIIRLNHDAAIVWHHFVLSLLLQIICISTYNLHSLLLVTLKIKNKKFITINIMIWLYSPIQEDQKMATRLASTMFNSLKGRPVQVAYYLYTSCGMWPFILACNEWFLQGRIFQGKEPPQFVALFQPMVVLKVLA